jgi:hypothetical protein
MKAHSSAVLNLQDGPGKWLFGGRRPQEDDEEAWQHLFAERIMGLLVWLRFAPPPDNTLSGPAEMT